MNHKNEVIIPCNFDVFHNMGYIASALMQESRKRQPAGFEKNL